MYLYKVIAIVFERNGVGCKLKVIVLSLKGQGSMQIDLPAENVKDKRSILRFLSMHLQVSESAIDFPDYVNIPKNVSR